ncbi:MAG: hypothetical protein V1809_08470 [Planctomycetota bacterium]
MADDDKSREISSDPHKRFYQSLTREESMLLVLRDELYSGSWDRMIHDLEDRLKGKPYIFKLVNRIEEDIERIRKLKVYEERHKINLINYR